jgi:hypothetical protein
LLETKGLIFAPQCKSYEDFHVVPNENNVGWIQNLNGSHANDLNHVVATKTNLEYHCDVEVVIGLMCIMPMLKVVHALIKFVQACDTFLWFCDCC